MFLFLNVKRHIPEYVEGQPVNDPRVAIRATCEYIHSWLVTTDTREWSASCIYGESRIQLNIAKWQSNQLDGGGMYCIVSQSIVFLANLYPYMSFCVPTWGMSALGRRGAIRVYNRCPLMCEVRGERWTKYIIIFNSGENSEIQWSRRSTWNKYIVMSYT